MSFLLFPLLPLACLVNIIWDCYWSRREPVKVNAKVISVGNVTVGGSGKTSLAGYIAEQLLAQGKHVALVARGYGRLSGRPTAANGRSPITWESFGDEPAALARAIPGLHMYIDSSKTEAARQAAKGGLRYLIVDDGFQHRRLHRDLDIVCLEGERPFGNGFLLPVGRLREPIRSLKRADALVAFGVPTEILGKLREYGKPIFRARKKVSAIKSLDGQSADIAGKKLVAFCGLGNPDSFRQSLDGIGWLDGGLAKFRDHHIYKKGDIDSILERIKVTGSSGAITTMKDLVKIERMWPDGTQLYCLQISIELDNESEFLKLLDV